MQTLFIVCVAFGAIMLFLQIGLSLFGLDHDSPDHVDFEGGLSLLSVRSLSAGVAGYGIGGLAALAIGLPDVLSLAAGVVPGLVAAFLTALLTRAMLRMEESGSLRLEEAVGRSGTIHLSVPNRGEGAGKVQFELQGRTVEMKAVSAEGPVRSGASVIIVGLIDDDTVEIVPTPTLKEIFE